MYRGLPHQMRGSIREQLQRLTCSCTADIRKARANSTKIIVMQRDTPRAKGQEQNRSINLKGISLKYKGLVDGRDNRWNIGHIIFVIHTRDFTSIQTKLLFPYFFSFLFFSFLSNLFLFSFVLLILLFSFSFLFEFLYFLFFLDCLYSKLLICCMDKGTTIVSIDA